MFVQLCLLFVVIVSSSWTASWLTILFRLSMPTVTLKKWLGVLLFLSMTRRFKQFSSTRKLSKFIFMSLFFSVLAESLLCWFLLFLFCLLPIAQNCSFGCSAVGMSTQGPTSESFIMPNLVESALQSSQPTSTNSSAGPPAVCPCSDLLCTGGGDNNPDSRFRPPTSDEIIKQLSSKTFAENMERKVQWAVNLFDTWRQNRLKMPTCLHEIMFCNLKDPQRVNKGHLAKVLSFFITEIR